MRLQRILPWLLWAAVAIIISGETTTTTIIASPENDNNNDELEDQIASETINAGRGHRDEQGVRDQWNSEKHIGQESKFDSRRPISPDVKRLLQLYRLECFDCDHYEAMSLVNDFVRTAKLEVKKQARTEWWISRGIGVLATLMCAVIGIWFVFFPYNKKPSGPMDLFLDEKKQSEIQELRRQQTVNAAIQRRAPPTWRDNERKEVWTIKQEQQFQKALREFGGVPKKERYLLIADKVHGKSRIECLTHHRMQQLMEQEQEQEQE